MSWILPKIHLYPKNFMGITNLIKTQYLNETSVVGSIMMRRHWSGGGFEVITIGGDLFINETTVGRSLSLRVKLLIEPTLDGV